MRGLQWHQYTHSKLLMQLIHNPSEHFSGHFLSRHVCPVDTHGIKEFLGTNAERQSSGSLVEIRQKRCVMSDFWLIVMPVTLDSPIYA